MKYNINMTDVKSDASDYFCGGSFTKKRLWENFHHFNDTILFIKNVINILLLLIMMQSFKCLQYLNENVQFPRITLQIGNNTTIKSIL